MKKRCNKCLELSNISEFSKDKSTKDGYKTICKNCDYLNHKKFIEANPNYRKAYYQNNKQKCLNSHKSYRLKNSEAVNKRKRAWEKSNEIKFKNTRRVYEKTRRLTDLNFKLIKQIRVRISNAITRNQKSGSAIKDLGCTIEEYKLYLESKFQPGMTWDNWTTDGWHIDHIRPLSSFDLSNPDEFKQAVHYTNTQPLWAKDNLRKGSSSR